MTIPAPSLRDLLEKAFAAWWDHQPEATKYNIMSDVDWARFKEAYSAGFLARQPEIEAQDAREDALVAVVEICAARFREYEHLHLEKTPSDTEKAARNAEMAVLCERALAKAGAVMDLFPASPTTEGDEEAFEAWWKSSVLPDIKTASGAVLAGARGAAYEAFLAGRAFRSTPPALTESDAELVREARAFGKPGWTHSFVEAFAEYERAMREDVIPAIEADEKANALAAAKILLKPLREQLNKDPGE